MQRTYPADISYVICFCDTITADAVKKLSHAPVSLLLLSENVLSTVHGKVIRYIRYTFLKKYFIELS